MKCPLCRNAGNRVIESRQNPSGTSIRRRRECNHCEYRFTSYETIEEVPLTVIKKTGSREKFDLKKIEHSIYRAIVKRTVSHSSIEDLLHTIEDEATLMSRSTHEIRSETIGELVLDKLFKIDKVAYVRFASVYRQFENVEEFVKVIETFASDTLNLENGEDSNAPLFMKD
ncbi:Ribonucleotide reductase transcriptional regulator NrdR [Olavius algarvensis spirochete endosymbiont]|uniref:transcriptional regulator NrdR n=1 Tax=Olavius algarvensis spirochete endosymbiont TaxID=260710 RepID=UPI00097BE55F|nr:transcriptional regulator NrdR [Olavius algarvensis spirochete endosymbiont]VDB00735.1 Ribonucleotide reductase transcriptional regulator NrdR [Olavius algarvensis spirochete endosymbiont]